MTNRDEEIPSDQTRAGTAVLTPGALVAQYRIVRKIGAGGMGEVYLAEDTKLDRQVALKFLPLHLIASDELRQRFYREAKAVARLNHPNIVTVHDVGDFGGTPYLAMEYVAGNTLQPHAPAASRSINDIVGVALQICQGLAEAHRTGIVHRDIKPGNIIVDESGRVRILDFGLAALSGSEELTRAGSTLGTVAYMSPEQVSGRNLDRRSDLFSFGILLHEMLTGRNPFKRDNDGATLRAIMEAAPEPVTAIRPDCPERLLRVVQKALEKDVELRYQSGEDVIADLKKLLYDSQPAGPAPVSRSEDRSIVVLPFANLSADPENEYFSDGLTEEIITDLSGVGKLRVISRSSSNLLKATQKNSRTIGNELGVRYILAGSVRKAGNSVRITAQLVEAATDSQVWADKYSGSLDDIFEMQEKVSRAIVDTLKVELTSRESEQMAACPIADPRAYEFYLRARQDIHAWNEAALVRAESYLHAGMEIMGENALLYAALGWVCVQYVNIGVRHDAWIEKAREYADKALELDPSVSEGHHVKGLIASYFDGAILEAMAFQREALKRNPNDSDALYQLIFDLAMTGSMNEARLLTAQLRIMDPLTRKGDTMEAWLAFLSGDFPRHLELRRQALAADPSRLTSRTWVAAAYAFAGDAERAWETMQGLEPDNFAVQLTLALVLGLRDERERALALVTADLERTALRDPQFSVHFAETLAIAGEPERALTALEQGIRQGFWNYPFLAKFDPFLALLREHARFQSLMEDVKGKWESVAAQSHGR